MLEDARDYIIGRVSNHYTVSSTKWVPVDLCPAIQKKIEKLKVIDGECIPKRGMAKKFQVATVHEEQFTINLAKHSCSRRNWNLTRIPCNHAISIIFFNGRDSQVSLIDHYRVDTF